MVLKIIGRREDSTGANTHYKLSNGQLVTRAQAVAMQKQGKLPRYHVVEVNGVEYLRDNPDNSPSDNIDKQPLV